MQCHSNLNRYLWIQYAMKPAWPFLITFISGQFQSICRASSDWSTCSVADSNLLGAYQCYHDGDCWRNPNELHDCLLFGWASFRLPILNKVITISRWFFGNSSRVLTRLTMRKWLERVLITSKVNRCIDHDQSVHLNELAPLKRQLHK